MSQIGTEFLRVRQRDTDAGPISVTRGMYDFNPDAYEVLDDSDATDSGGAPLAPDHVLALQPEDESPYEGWRLAELQAEVDRRNEARDPEGEYYLSRAGKKADLVASLDADDTTPQTPGGDVPGTPGL